jgi:RNA polymerase sigma-70 factor (ECF subfamily)
MFFKLFQRKNYHKLSNEELLESYRVSADNEALGILYERHLELVFATCNRYLENEAASQDAVLDIYEQLTEKVKLHDIQNFESWLFILTKNHCLMQLRKRKSTIVIPIDDYGHLPAEENKSSEEHEEHELEIQSLQECINRLPEEQKRAISLFYLEEKSYKEVSDILNEDVTKVRSYIQNGRRNLKICMGSKNME